MEVPLKAAKANQYRSPRRSVDFHLEALEDRCLLSTKSAPVITFSEIPDTSSSLPGATILTITGTKKNDSISINDNGTGTAGNIFVSTGTGQNYMSSGAVSELAVVTGKGTDRVAYELDGKLQPNVSELIEVGSSPKGKPGGSVQLTVNIVGKVLDQASLTILEPPDPTHKNTMTVNDSGEVDGDLTAGIATIGSKNTGHGPEALAVQSTATIGSTGFLDIGMIGSKANDTANVSYSGTNDGELEITELGDGGNDQLAADVYMIPGSTGTVGSSGSPSTLQTSGKKDSLRFTIHQGTDSTTTTNILATVIDTSKKDISTHTGNVVAQTKGVDSVVV
jgi:hypothetical protein